ncbi:MAG: hypothetical protein KJ658_15020, partial [Proteobacteria bacterium]|nr:hypothetical protein [Pseudomonadota bacterium]
AFGDKIDYTQAFMMWMEDHTTADTQYTKTQVDMNISEAKISNWKGSAPGSDQYRYQLTVVDDASLGDKAVIQTDGIALAQVASSTTDVAAALNLTLAEQNITIDKGPSGTEVIKIKDTGGDAKRSAASIAAELSAVEGVQAYASAVSAGFDVAGIADAENGDEVQFSLYVDGVVHQQRFTVDPSQGTLAEQFEDAIRGAAESINTIYGDQDLYTNGLSMTSSSGRTLGIQDFEVLDNSGVRIGTFSNFNASDTVTFTVASSGFGTSGATTTDISVALPAGINTGDQAQMATVFYDALRLALKDEPFTVEKDPSTNAILLRTTDGSDLTVRDGGNDTGLDASFNITSLDGTLPFPATNAFPFDGVANIDTYSANTLNTDIIGFTGNGTLATIGEASAGGVSAGVITGTITILTNPGMTVYSNIAGAGGLFNGNWAKPGSSIMTLGGENGFRNFSPGETISFTVDDIVPAISFGVVPGFTSDLDFANSLFGALGALGPDYEIIQNGTLVSILKNASLDDPIKITNFTETGVGADAALVVKTGTGSGTSAPENDLLESGNTHRNFATASLYSDEGIIKWEKYDANGLFTGQDGFITIEEEGRISIVESGVTTLSFEIAKGSLVAGNTLIINTDENGAPDPLDFTIYGSANNQNETYQFTVKSGGKVGGLTKEEDPIVIEWKTDTASGIIKLEGSTPPLALGAAFEVKVDGMTLNFYDGTLFKND